MSKDFFDEVRELDNLRTPGNWVFIPDEHFHEIQACDKNYSIYLGQVIAKDKGYREGMDNFRFMALAPRMARALLAVEHYVKAELSDMEGVQQELWEAIEEAVREK